MNYLISIILVAFTMTIWAQEPLVITVVKKSNEPLIESEEFRDGSVWSSFLMPWRTWNTSTSSFQPDFDLYPMVSAEYDVSYNETAHMYNLGADIGSERLMMGVSVRIPTHNPTLEEIGGVQLAFRAVKKWDFRRIRTTELRVIQKRLANFQLGTEYIFDTNVSKNSENITENSRRIYLSPFLGVFHPIYDRLLLGVKYKRHLKLAKTANTYSAISLDFSYFFDF